MLQILEVLSTTHPLMRNTIEWKPMGWSTWRSSSIKGSNCLWEQMEKHCIHTAQARFVDAAKHRYSSVMWSVCPQHWNVNEGSSKLRTCRLNYIENLFTEFFWALCTNGRDFYYTLGRRPYIACTGLSFSTMFSKRYWKSTCQFNYVENPVESLIM